MKIDEMGPAFAAQVDSPGADGSVDENAEQIANDEDARGVAGRLIAKYRAAFRELADLL